MNKLLAVNNSMKPAAQGVFGSPNAKHRHYPRWAAEEEEEEEEEDNSRTKGEHQLLATHAKRKKH
ncbi:hypothetical protein [Alcaligenes sp. CHO6]|uniref:hypothetical protein n=1 Tax=Alcaligenes sp. CHO6 TaxID=3123298 RepID=UPI0030157E40